MRKLLILYLTLSVCSHCASFRHGKKFFDYDEIDYYSIVLPEEKVTNLYENKLKSPNDSLKKAIILDSTPKDIADLSFIGKLETFGFKKKVLSHSLFPYINEVFIERPAREVLTTSCIYVYRDILIFKKNKKVIGTAKICFECMAHEIIGTSANTENFGQNGDYAKLQRLLRK